MTDRQKKSRKKLEEELSANEQDLEKLESGKIDIKYTNKKELMDSLKEDIISIKEEIKNYKGLFNIVSGNEMLKMEIKTMPYIIDKLIPECAITAVTADSGKGKSLIALILAYHISRGEKLFNEFEVKQSKVLIIDQEMDEDIIISRHQSVAKKQNTNIDYIYSQLIEIDKPDHYGYLIETIKEGGYQVIMFDTLIQLHSGNENSADEMKEVNRLLLNLINETGVTIIYLHHHRKKQRGEYPGQSSSRGSTEIIAKVSSHLLIDSKPKVEDEITQTNLTIQQEKSRRPEKINKIGVKIFYDQCLKETHWEYLGEVNDNESKIQKAKELIKEDMPEGEWLNINEIQDLIGYTIGESNLREACRELVKEKILAEKLGSELGKDNKRAKYYCLITEDIPVTC